jgi:hypothetical protein
VRLESPLLLVQKICLSSVTKKSEEDKELGIYKEGKRKKSSNKARITDRP